MIFDFDFNFLVFLLHVVMLAVAPVALLRKRPQDFPMRVAISVTDVVAAMAAVVAPGICKNILKTVIGISF